MRFTQLPNFRVEDFGEQQSWIGKLFIQLNPFVQAVNQVINNNIDFSTNIIAVTNTYNVTSGFTAFSFAWSNAASPSDVRVVSAYKGNQNTPTTLFIAWSYDSGKKLISVTQMVEVVVQTSGVTLAALSGSYQFTIRATV